MFYNIFISGIRIEDISGGGGGVKIGVSLVMYIEGLIGQSQSISLTLKKKKEPSPGFKIGTT